jgi:hypothetical protein
MGIVIVDAPSADITLTQASYAGLPTPLSRLSEAFCWQLVQHYRFNILDYAVFQDRGLRMVPRDAVAFDPDKSDVNLFRLGMAAMCGDARLVREAYYCAFSLTTT